MRRGLYVLLGVLLVPTVGLVGDVVTDGTFKSTLSSGAPLEVSSSDMVVNLNADMVDGVEGTDLYTKAEVDALLADVLAAVAPREFYLTALPDYDGDEALGACSTGFHMASLWEIADLSNLRYAYDHPDAFFRDDAGHGPPTMALGWIRTGYVSSGDPYAGEGNCDGWTVDSGLNSGTVAYIPSRWADPSGGNALVWGTPWASYSDGCEWWYSVWCVED
jgi:hypothetical protein